MNTQEQELRAAVHRINGRAWGIALGLVCGVALFLATNYLVWDGGQDPGRHLRLLAVFFPGFRITFFGSLIGFVYAFVVGYGLGRIVGVVYNKLTDMHL